MNGPFPGLTAIVASLVNTLIILGIAWKAVRVINRVMGILQDYPPHRHINGKVIYAKGFEPTPVETIGANNGRGEA